MNKPKRCVRCGCNRLQHGENGCLGHVKCKTGVTESRYFTERSRRSKTKQLSDHEVKNTEYE